MAAITHQPPQHQTDPTHTLPLADIPQGALRTEERESEGGGEGERVKEEEWRNWKTGTMGWMKKRRDERVTDYQGSSIL